MSLCYRRIARVLRYRCIAGSLTLVVLRYGRTDATPVGYPT